MTTLQVDRLHARYHLDRPELAGQLDDCLRRVVATELAAALSAAAVPDSAEHTCVPRLSVPVRLDPGGGAAVTAREWARAIADAVQQAVLAGTGVVVYPRTLDALVDLVVSLGRGDRGREWAWVQAGLLPGPGRAADPAAATEAALLARPDLAPAALVAAAAEGPVALRPAGWLAVVDAVLAVAPERIRRTGRSAPPVAELPLAGPGGQDRTASGTSAAEIRVAEVAAPESAAAERPVTEVPVTEVPVTEVPAAAAALAAADAAAAAERSAAGVLAAPLTRLLAGVAGHSTADRATLARLAVLCAAPPLLGADRVVDAVAAALAGRPAAPAARPRRERRPGPPDHPAARVDRDPGPAPCRPGRTPTPATSEFGGLLFLIRLTDQLDLVNRTSEPDSGLATRPYPWILARLACRLAGAEPTDPAVLVLAGPPIPDLPHPPPTTVEQAALAALVRRIRQHLRATLRPDPADRADRDGEPAWLWRWRATILAEPGWVEARLALADVDTGVRMAGLDLDPGFVWWLGAVVRFRYV